MCLYFFGLKITRLVLQDQIFCLLCIVGELVGGGSLAVALGVAVAVAVAVAVGV